MASMEKESRDKGGWPPHQLPCRTILNGKYMVQRVLGEGGFGITYEGWDLNLELKVAIKEYFPSGFVTRGNTDVIAHTGSSGEYYEKGKQKFLSEAKILARFYFLPGIVGVKDFFLENNTAYIVMEFLDGMTLKEYTEQAGGRLEAGQVLELMRPVMDSLAQVHRSGLIHRDISPENIMLTKEGQVKLLDFGAARDISPEGERSLSVLLKPGYAPEEQYRTHGEQGPWTDVYALCATMYRCMTGESPQEPLERARHDGLRPPSMLGAGLTPRQDMAVMKGLSLYSENRYRSIEELEAALYGTGEENRQKAAEPAAGQSGSFAPGYRGEGRQAGGAYGGTHGPQASDGNGTMPAGALYGGRPADGRGGAETLPEKRGGSKKLLLLLLLLICALAGGGIWLLGRRDAGTPGQLAGRETSVDGTRGEETDPEETDPEETDAEGEIDPELFVYQGRDLDHVESVLARIDSSEMVNVPVGEINSMDQFEYRVDSYTPPDEEETASGGSQVLYIPVSYRCSTDIVIEDFDFLIIAMNEEDSDLKLCVSEGNMGEGFPLYMNSTDGGVGQLILEFEVPAGYEYVFTYTNIWGGEEGGPLYLTFLE